MSRRIDMRYLMLVPLLAGVLTCVLPELVRSQEIDECLECHADRNLTKTDAGGTTRSLFVDKKLFLESVHGRLDYTCMECHEAATLDHPAEGVPDVTCATCHEEVQKRYAQSAHGKRLVSQDPKAPQCYDCHTMHYTFSPEDPRSSTHQRNIPVTCSACHQELVNGPGRLASLVVARLRGHGKVNLAGEFRIDRCLDCHGEVANHGTEERAVSVCAKCHEPGNNTLNLGPVHTSEIFRKAPLRIAVKLSYGFGLAMVGLALMSMVGKKYAQTRTLENEKQGAATGH